MYVRVSFIGTCMWIKANMVFSFFGGKGTNNFLNTQNKYVFFCKNRTKMQKYLHK